MTIHPAVLMLLFLIIGFKDVHWFFLAKKHMRSFMIETAHSVKEYMKILDDDEPSPPGDSST